ncbi:MAG: 2-oxo acid dehydrogenase subunit E2, partial [Casimicrobiaceae bacterium]
MAAIEVVLPKVDMDMTSGVIAAWKVAEGDAVSQGDVLFEMETDKSMMEVEAPGSGVIRELAAINGEQVAVGTVVAWIHPAGEEVDADAPAAAHVAPAAPAAVKPPVAPVHGAPADATLQPFNPTRRLLIERLGDSTRNAPHFFLSMQVDMTALQRALREGPQSAPRASITVALAFLAGRVLLAHPLVNASVEEGGVRLHDAAHIGIAVERDADLLVPVLRDAHTRTLAELAGDFARLRAAVDARSIAAADLRGGTFTLSNLGMYGVDAFTAIINPPESAILAIGRAVDTPVVRDGAIV